MLHKEAKMKTGSPMKPKAMAGMVIPEFAK